jgi:hypothetical protein
MEQLSSTSLFSSSPHGNGAQGVPQGMSNFEEAPMTFEYDEKGKIFTDVVSKVVVPATIQTTTHLIRGQIHVRRDQRIKDELDVNENFLAVTEVSVLGPDGQTLFQAPFLAVRRSHIIWVLPEENQSGEKSS